MPAWDNAHEYARRYFKTTIELYYCPSHGRVALTQPWQPWVSYITLPERTVVYIESVERLPPAPKGWFGGRDDPCPFRAWGYFPPFTHTPIDLTALVKAAVHDPAILRIDRRLSYGGCMDVVSLG